MDITTTNAQRLADQVALLRSNLVQIVQLWSNVQMGRYAKQIGRVHTAAGNSVDFGNHTSASAALLSRISLNEVVRSTLAVCQAYGKHQTKSPLDERMASIVDRLDGAVERLSLETARPLSKRVRHVEYLPPSHVDVESFRLAPPEQTGLSASEYHILPSIVFFGVVYKHCFLWTRYWKRVPSALRSIEPSTEPITRRFVATTPRMTVIGKRQRSRR